MNLYLSHAFAALAGGVIQFGVGRFVRTVVIAQIRERRAGREPARPEQWQSRIIPVISACLSILALLGIVTTYAIIDRYHRAGDCRRDAVLESTHDTARMLDRILDRAATPVDRAAAVEQWRRDQDETELRIRACDQ